MYQKVCVHHAFLQKFPSEFPCLYGSTQYFHQKEASWWAKKLEAKGRNQTLGHSSDETNSTGYQERGSILG